MGVFLQGLESLKEHFKNSKFPCEMDHYLPVVFWPPRDGRKLTEPMPIGGQRQSITIGLSTTPSCSGNDEMEEGEEEEDDVATTTTTTLVDQQEESMKGNNNSSNSSSGSIDEDDTDGDEYDQVS